MELCPVLQSPHMKRERLEVHLHEKRLSSCVCVWRRVSQIGGGYNTRPLSLRVLGEQL